MSRRSVLALALGALLLTTTSAAQSPVLASSRGSAVPASQSRLVALTQSYFVALNSALVAGNLSDLRAVFAARATLTERGSFSRIEPTPWTSTVRGRSAIIQFCRHLSDDVAGSRWVVGVMHQTSSITMVAYARIERTKSTPWVYSRQRLTMRNGRIVNLDLTIYYLQ